ncbi:MAG TPA: glycosyltransferase family 39 protein [Chthoniobacterales bacterium]|nr:glycosyltransferase family 39 protein [Chthoniobacterales bacterium]
MTGEPLVEESGWPAVLEQRWAIVTLAILATLLLSLANFPWTLDEYDQAKQAFTSFEMVKEGHWLYQDTPNGKVATKPPLVGWISAGIFEVTRSWGIAWRLPSLAAAFAMWILLIGAARRAFGNFAALVAMSAFCLNLLTPRLATLVRTDMPLALVIFALGLQIWEKVRRREPWTRRDRLIFFLLLTAAMLIKGPIVYAFLLPGIIVFQWTMRKNGEDARAWPGWWPWIASLAVFLLWVMGGIFLVPNFYDEVVVREFAARFSQTMHRPQPTYFYILHLLHKFAPWSILLIALAATWFRQSKLRFRQIFKSISPATLWLICWCVGAIFVMSIVPSKRVDRIFPVIAPLCLLVAAQIGSSKVDSELSRRVRRWSAIAVVVGVVITGEYAVAKAIKEWRHRQLAVFGYNVRHQAAAENLHYEILGRRATGPGKGSHSVAPEWRLRRRIPKPTGATSRFKDGVLLLYLDRTHFFTDEEAIKAWNDGTIDSLVAPETEWSRLAQELHDVATTPRFEGATNHKVGYIFITH